MIIKVHSENTNIVLSSSGKWYYGFQINIKTSVQHVEVLVQLITCLVGHKEYYIVLVEIML